MFSVETIAKKAIQEIIGAPDYVERGNGGEIYLIWFDNDPSHKCYVGQTIQGTEKRIQQHIADARSIEDGCPLLDNATRHFGINHLCYKVLESGITTHDELDALERKYIAQYHSQAPYGYNLTSGGQKKTTAYAYAMSSKKAQNPLLYAVAEAVVDNSNFSPLAKNALKTLFK